MTGVKTTNAVICAVLLAIAATPVAKAQTQKELTKQYERAKRDCVNKFPTDIPKTILAKVECLNRAQAVALPTWGNNRDLIQTWMAYRIVIAERIQNKKMTAAEGATAIAQRWSETQTEIQHRNAYAALAGVQQNPAQYAVAQQNAATPGAKAQTPEELFAQYERDKRDCVNEFPTDIPKTIVAKVGCLNEAQAVVLPTWGNNRDLIQAWMAYRIVIAERIENKKITVAEGDSAIAQRWSQAQTEIQRRNTYAALAGAQQNPAQNSVAQQNAVAPGAKAQTPEELDAQYERAKQDCVSEFPTDIPKTIVAKVGCLNEAQAVVLPTWGNNRDLIQAWMAYRAVIAVRVQNKEMTVVEGESAVAQRWSQARTEIQRRNAYAAQAGASQNAAVDAAGRANAAADPQTWVNTFQAFRPAPPQ